MLIISFHPAILASSFTKIIRIQISHVKAIIITHSTTGFLFHIFFTSPRITITTLNSITADSFITPNTIILILKF